MRGHIQQLKLNKGSFSTPNGKLVDVRQLIVPTDEKLISDWAKHFREQYCSDNELNELIEGTDYENNRGRYLKEMVLPSGSQRPGPSLRAGDFAEILVADYLEFVKSYWIPRNRFEFRATRHDSTPGSDIVAIKFVQNGDVSPDDVLTIWESKARLSKKSINTLQDAVDHSGKDFLRYAHTLNAIKRRYRKCGESENADKIKRFQNLEDNPFRLLYGAVAVCTTSSIDDVKFFQVDDSEHPKAENLHLLVFHGADLMTFVHKLYKKAIDEAG